MGRHPLTLGEAGEHIGQRRAVRLKQCRTGKIDKAATPNDGGHRFP
jgi:hypothetical protein